MRLLRVSAKMHFPWQAVPRVVCVCVTERTAEGGIDGGRQRERAKKMRTPHNNVGKDLGFQSSLFLGGKL